jgi:hypothetical protein
MLNLPQLVKFVRTSLRGLLDVLKVFRTGLRSRGALAAENLLLRSNHEIEWSFATSGLGHRNTGHRDSLMQCPSLISSKARAILALATKPKSGHAYRRT